MPAQAQEFRKNYIGLLSDKLEEQREAIVLTKSAHPVKEYLRDLLAAVLNRYGAAQ